MPPRPQWPKLSIETYIHEHKEQQTRYEIDSTLLQAGYGPEEIETAWQTLNSIPTKQSPISFRRLDSLVLSGSLLLGVFALFSPGFWPLVNYISTIYTLTALISLAAFIAIIFWGRKRKKAGAKESMLLFITNCILGLTFTGALFICVILSNYTVSHPEIATASVEGHDYHLLNTAACMDGCMYEVTLYKCSFFNLICPAIYDGGVLYSDANLPTHTVPNLAKISLKIDPSTGEILLLDDDKVVYTFKNV